MIEFVLHAHRQQAFAFQFERLAVAVLGLDPHAQGAVDVLVEARHRQAAFLVLAHVVGQLFDRGVDEDPRLAAVFAQVHDHDLLVHVDLGRGQADARGFVHGFKHVVDQLTQCVVELRHRFGNGAQARVREFENVQDGHKVRRSLCVWLKTEHT